MTKRNVDRKSNGGNGINRGGAPKGNLNAAKSIVPALKRLAQGRELPATLHRVVTLAESEADGLLSDKGGVENMSEGEHLMIATWKSARQAELLIWHSVLSLNAAVTVDEERKTWDLQPGLQRLAPFLMAQHRALVALGLQRRARPVPDLQQYLKENYGAEE